MDYSNVITLEGIKEEKERIKQDFLDIENRKILLSKQEDMVYEHLFFKYVKEGDIWDNWNIVKIGTEFTTFEYKKRKYKLHHSNICRKIYRYSKRFKQMVKRDEIINSL